MDRKLTDGQCYQNRTKIELKVVHSFLKWTICGLFSTESRDFVNVHQYQRYSSTCLAKIWAFILSSNLKFITLYSKTLTEIVKFCNNFKYHDIYNHICIFTVLFRVEGLRRTKRSMPHVNFTLIGTPRLCWQKRKKVFCGFAANI